MPDPAEQLARIYAAGFDVQMFDRFPRAVGIIRDNVIALFEPAPAGLTMVGTPGWRMGEVMGVLVEESGRRVFRYKDQVVEATAARLATVAKFRDDLEVLLQPQS